MLRLRVLQCSEAWVEMPRDADRRYCTKCDRHVYDLSAGTEERARELVARGECVRFQPDASGAVAFLRSLCLAAAAVAMVACTPTGVDSVADPLAVEPVEPVADVTFVPAPPPPRKLPTGIEHVISCDRSSCVGGAVVGVTGGAPVRVEPVKSAVMGVPGPRSIRAELPRLRTAKARRWSKRTARKAGRRQAKAARRLARAERKEARHKARDRRQLARAARRADRRAALAVRRFARAEKTVAKIEARRARRQLARATARAR